MKSYTHKARLTSVSSVTKVDVKCMEEGEIGSEQKHLESQAINVSPAQADTDKRSIYVRAGMESCFYNTEERAGMESSVKFFTFLEHIIYDMIA